MTQRTATAITAVAERRAALRISHEKIARKMCIDAESPWEAADLATVARHIKRIEKGQVNPGDDYKRFLARALRSTPAELFGEPVDEAPAATTLAVTSHKFAPVFVDAQAIPALAAAMNLSAAESSIAHYSWSGDIPHPGGDARLYLFDWGIALAHVSESLDLPNIAALAKWRVSSYPRDMAWLSERLSAELGRPVDENYVLSAYWLDRGIWPASRLDAAIRLLSMPRVLLGETNPAAAAGAEECEKTLLRENFDHGGIVPFGVPGTSIGAASWSSVAYHPIVPSRGLAPADLVDVELLTQAMWCYARTICDQIEAGDEPAIPAAFGIRFLRGMRSRCFTARPQESSAHRSMREAIVQTSGLADQLDAAMAALRDI